MTPEPNICQHCGEEKPTPYVTVPADEPYCLECWKEMCEATYRDYVMIEATRKEKP